MLLRSTKKFFHKTLQSFKSLFNGSDYEKLPKTTPPHPFNTFSYPDSAYHSSYNIDQLEKFCTDYTNKWESSSGNDGRGKSSKKTVSTSPRQEKEVTKDNSLAKFSKQAVVVKNNNLHVGKVKHVHERRKQEYSYAYSKGMREGKISLVVQKLKELEMLDKSNVDHVLDIEEVLHYYSRLTCPAYLEIIDKFFMEVYAEFSGPLSTPSRSYNSNLRQKAVMMR